jgi:Zn-dependent protease with chaperone function
MVDFFGQQNQARQKTGRLVFYFIVAILLTAVLIYAAAVLILNNMGKRGGGTPVWNSELFMWVSAGTLLVIALGSLFKTLELSAGGKAIAEMLGGRLLDQSMATGDERQLLNVIEEMAIASGVPVPDVYLLDKEDGINAFAAGYTINDAVIGVTRGCMQKLNRDELQGVMAHEFSHIFNGDMKLNQRLTGWIHGLLFIAILGRILLHFGHVRSSSNRNNATPIFGLALLLIGGVGMLFGRLIKAAISRQREFLADASAVQFTRNPAGIAGALKKIGGFSSKLESPKAEEASHMLFGSGVSSFMQAFSTHPPLPERIARLDATFKADAADAYANTGTGSSNNLVSQMAGGTTQASASASAAGTRPAPPAARSNVTASQVVQQIGWLDQEHIDHAHELINSLPTELVEAAHHPFSAVALGYGLLISSDVGVRKQQLEALAANENGPIVSETQRVLGALAGIDARSRVPLLEMALPALRQIAPTQYQAFRHNVRVLSEADRQIDLFEFALEKILVRYLEPTFVGARETPVRYSRIEQVRQECNVLLSAIAYMSHEEDREVQRAYASSIAVFGGQMKQLPLNECGLGVVDAAMNRLAESTPDIKRQLVMACAESVTADGVIRAEEAELLRAVCATLDVPCPPLL